MSYSLLLAQVQEPAAGMSATDFSMLLMNAAALALFVWIGFRIVMRSGNLQSRALVQIEKSLQHMDKYEQFMALQEKQGNRIIELLESIDRNSRQSP